MENLIPPEVPFELGPHRFQSRLFLGTGKYASYAEMRDALALSGTECVTVAVRRIPEGEAQGEQFLDFIDRERYTLLP
ncbi:MAG: thiazole synthase, partial [Planctomycetota bacterium]|nr:thiazole synthase [Planctomycetota bacterium]